MKRLIVDKNISTSVTIDNIDDKKLIVVENDFGRPGILTNTPNGWVFVNVFAPANYWGYCGNTANEVVEHYLRACNTMYQFDTEKEFVEYLAGKV